MIRNGSGYVKPEAYQMANGNNTTAVLDQIGGVLPSSAHGVFGSARDLAGYSARPATTAPASTPPDTNPTSVPAFQPGAGAKFVAFMRTPAGIVLGVLAVGGLLWKLKRGRK